MELLTAILTTCGASIISGIFSLTIVLINAKKEKAAAEAAAKERKEQEDNAILKTLDGLDKKLDSHIQEDCEAKADEGRLRVLRFGDEVRRGIQHTEEHWTDILRDIDRYENYCDTHPNYENNRATRTIQYLKNIFDEHLENNDFLK